MLTRSILGQRAEKRKIPDILRARPNTQAILYCETLIEMIIFLDTNVLRKLTKSSVDVLTEDVIKVITGLLVFQTTAFRPREIKTIDGVLESLRLARDNFQVAYGMFKNELVNENKSAKFLAELRLARKNIAKSLEAFDKDVVSSLRTKISNELLKGN